MPAVSYKYNSTITLMTNVRMIGIKQNVSLEIPCVLRIIFRLYCIDKMKLLLLNKKNKQYCKHWVNRYFCCQQIIDVKFNAQNSTIVTPFNIENNLQVFTLFSMSSTV